MIAFLRHRLHPLDETRKRKLMRMWWNYCSDCGEFVAIFIGTALGVGVCVLVWLAIVAVEKWLR